MSGPSVSSRASRRSVRTTAILGRAGALALALAAAAPLARAQGGPPDFAYFHGAQIVQAVQYGSTGLVARKSTFVRLLVMATGTVPPGTKVDGLMRVFVGGVEVPGSPIYSDNGPIAPQAFPSLEDENGSLNFAFLPQVWSNAVLVLELNPAGPSQVPESDYSNNTFTSAPQTFACRGTAEFVYVPIDYKPSGSGPPNPPDPFLIEPGMGDSFVEAIYASGDWNYHRSVVPSKLWTQSVAGSGSALLSSLAVDQQLMVPVPDFIYGFVPGGLGYNGMTLGIPGSVMMGNTEPIRFQRTVAHELGHCFGLSHNSTTVNQVGADVEDQLALPLALPTIKSASLKDIMYAGLLTQEAWVAQNSFNTFYNSFHLACPTADSAGPDPRPALLVAGEWNRATGALELSDALSYDDGSPTPSVPASEADLLVHAFVGSQLVGAAALAVNTAADCGTDPDAAADTGASLPPVGGFAAVIAPSAEVDRIDRVQIVDRRGGTVLWELRKSPAAPVAAFVDPRPGQFDGGAGLAWQGSDADGDAIAYYLRYSPDGERVVPLATKLEQTHWPVDLGELPAFQPGRGYFELLASDGLNTTRIRTGALPAGASTGDGAGNAPWAYLTTPDNGKQFPKGATVILHANAWDLEDLMLEGGSIAWSSSLDGPIGSGRVDTVADLSVGTHVLSMSATDLDGNVTIDTAIVTIVERVLPGTGGQTCQLSLGFAGPGASSLSLCGGDLSTGTSADLVLSSAPAGAPAWLAISTTNNPTPLLGGTLVPVPVGSLLTGATDGAGTWTFAGIQGGGGPHTVYVQAATLDLGLPELVAFSNALKVDFLP